MRISFIALFFVSSLVWAHGEDKPGPHGGFIRMPGGFHTEILPDENSLKVFLIDMNWKNPSIKNSSVKVSLDEQPWVDCKAEKEFFRCPVIVTARHSRLLKVVAVREGAKGNEATYALPLSLEAKATHGSHK